MNNAFAHIVLAGAITLASAVSKGHSQISIPNHPSVGQQDRYIVGDVQTQDGKGVHVRVCPSLKCEIVGGLREGGPYFFNSKVLTEWLEYEGRFVHKDFVKIKAGKQEMASLKTLRPPEASAIAASVNPVIEKFRLGPKVGPQQIDARRIQMISKEGQSFKYELKMNATVMKGYNADLGNSQRVHILSNKEKTYCRLTKGSQDFFLAYDNATKTPIEHNMGLGVQVWDLWNPDAQLVGYETFKPCIYHDGFYLSLARGRGFDELVSGPYRNQRKPVFAIPSPERLRMINNKEDLRAIQPSYYYSPSLFKATKAHVVRHGAPSLFLYYKNSTSKPVTHLKLPDIELKIQGEGFTLAHKSTQETQNRFLIHALSDIEINGFKIKKNETIEQVDLMTLLYLQKKFPELKPNVNLGFVRNVDEESQGDQVVFIKFPEHFKLGKLYEFNPAYKKIIINETGDILVYPRAIEPLVGSNTWLHAGKFVATPLTLEGAPARILNFNRFIESKKCNDQDEKMLTGLESYIQKIGLSVQDIDKMQFHDYKLVITLKSVASLLGVKDISAGSQLHVNVPACLERVFTHKLWIAGSAEAMGFSLLKDDEILFEESKITHIVRGKETLYNLRQLDLRKGLGIKPEAMYPLCLLAEIKYNPLRIPLCDQVDHFHRLDQRKLYRLDIKLGTLVVSPVHGRKDYRAYNHELLRSLNTLIVGDIEYLWPDVVSLNELGWDQARQIFSDGRQITYKLESVIQLPTGKSLCSESGDTLKRVESPFVGASASEYSIKFNYLVKHNKVCE